MDDRKKGTTTIGLTCDDGVVLASESKSTMGSLVAGKESQKVYQIDDRIAITTAGGVGDTQTLLRMLKAEINLYKLTRNADFTVKAAVTLLSNVMQGNRYFPYMAMLVLGGHDRDGYHVYSIDPVGGSDKDKYTATGSGSPFAYGVLEDNYNEGMSTKDGVNLAVRAIRSAAERDTGSGGKKIQIAVITEKGISFSEEDIVSAK